jgi:alkylmercury lyase
MMRPAEEHHTKRHIDLDEVAASIVGAFPTLDVIEQRLSLELYRLLAEGQPVPRAMLAERLSISVETVNQVLDRWPGIFCDPERRVVGYWGLSVPTAYSSPHQLTVSGRRLSAWCAWDTLFLPQLLGQTAEVESISPDPGASVRLTVTPERVERVDPVDTEMSFLLPDPIGVQKDVVTTFCHFIHFFPSRQIGESWAAKRAGTFMVSIDEAAQVARRKNEMQYRETLPRMLHAPRTFP